MAVIRLDIADFRNLASVKLMLLPQGFNFIYGNNGSGKTSFLEAIYYLSLGRSFRSSIVNRVICHTADKFSLFAHILTEAEQNIPIGLERHQDGSSKIRIAGTDRHSVIELASLMPVQLINSHCYNLLDAPVFRRKYLDWGAFYFSGEFLHFWKQFDRALKQRNTALRGLLSRSELVVWTKELVNSAIQLDRIRCEYVQCLLPILKQIVDVLLPIKDLELSYYPGWDGSFSYQALLEESFEKDRQSGYTQHGPHRADFKVIINRIPVKDFLSRGQQKLLVCAMILAQGILLHNYTNKKPIYLIDDLPSELDITSRSSLISLLSKQEAQVFVTAVERETLEGFLMHHSTKMFHVKHNGIEEVM